MKVKKKKSRIRRFSNKLSSITNILTKSFSGSSISSITSVKSQNQKNKIDYYKYIIYFSL